MNLWSQIQDNFKEAFEGSPITFTIIIFCMLFLPVAYHLFLEHLHRKLNLNRQRRALRKRGLSDKECSLVRSAILEFCPDNPERLLANVSMFNVWLDGLPDITRAPPEMIDCLENIRNELYHNKEAVAVPQSTRDLRMGVTLNLVRAHAGSVVHPCVVSGVDIRAMYLRSRGTGGLDVRSGEIVSLYMPRPEAMYYTECEVLGPGEQPATIALSHSVRGSFKTQQLREYWRVDVDIRIQYTNVSSPRLDETGMPRRSEGRLINLSGSGAAMVSGRAPQRGECLQFSLPLHDKEINGLEAEVLHVVKLPTHTYRLHMVFRSLGEEDREKIIRSLFHWYRNRMPSGSTES